MSLKNAPKVNLQEMSTKQSLTFVPVIDNEYGISYKRPVMVISTVTPLEMSRNLLIGPISMMDFLFYAIQDGRLEYDPNKSESTRKQRGIGFEKVMDVRYPPVIKVYQYKVENEWRYGQIVSIDDQLYFLTYTVRSNNARIISLHIAKRKLRDEFEHEVQQVLKTAGREYYLVSPRE